MLLCSSMFLQVAHVINLYLNYSLSPIKIKLNYKINYNNDIPVFFLDKIIVLSYIVFDVVY